MDNRRRCEVVRSCSGQLHPDRTQHAERVSGRRRDAHRRIEQRRGDGQRQPSTRKRRRSAGADAGQARHHRREGLQSMERRRQSGWTARRCDLQAVEVGRRKIYGHEPRQNPEGRAVDRSRLGKPAGQGRWQGRPLLRDRSEHARRLHVDMRTAEDRRHVGSLHERLQ